MLAALVNERGQVQVPGFYDDVLPLIGRERAAVCRSCRFDEHEFMQQLGVEAFAGEDGFTTLERRWARPTFDINGMWSGYQGEGAKTVLPARAGAKFSFRLVPNQDPEKIAAALERCLRAALSGGHQDGADRYARRAGRRGAAGQSVRGRGANGHRAAVSAERQSSFARGARSRSWRPFTNCWESIPYCWAGAWTTTTRTARTKSSAWPTSIAASRPVPILWDEMSQHQK